MQACVPALLCLRELQQKDPDLDSQSLNVKRAFYLGNSRQGFVGVGHGLETGTDQGTGNSQSHSNV